MHGIPLGCPDPSLGQMDKSLLYRPIFESPEFARYRDELTAWVAGGQNDAALHDAARAMCPLFSAGAMPPEHLLAALHRGALESADGPGSGPAAAHLHRFVDAITRLMRSCFGRDAGLRVVRGNDGRIWSVMPIAEGGRWDPEIEMRRRGWLCCVTTGDRRYISPVPREWEQWTESEIAGAIAGAKPDLRGG